MARAKNRGLQQSFSPSYTVRRWRLGEYIRLSKEDLKKGKDDSNSVINQRDLLNDFYQKHIGEFESVSEYVDDGHTGTDANRENFQRLLSDVMSGKINCVVVKDLSRFARNYSDAGSLIYNLFVQMGVRFISLAENVDSYLNPDSVSSIIVPITNVMNDQYCYQTSKKIRQVFDYKRRNGQYIGALRLRSGYGVNVTRVNRAGVDLIPNHNLQLQMGDRLTVVGSESAINAVSKILGNSMRRLNEPNLIPIFVGIFLGVVLGSVPIMFPGIPQPVKLGLAPT